MTDGSRPPDDYEAQYMAAEGVIYRDKIKAPGKFFLLLGLPTFIQTLVFSILALSGTPLPLAALGIVPVVALAMFLLGLLFAVLRVTVTKREVQVQYGLFGPKIPIEKIQACKAVTYDFRTYGGWGIRRGSDGSTAYNMVGDAGKAVRIEWLNEKGKKQVTLVASPGPEALALAIQKARGFAETPSEQDAKTSHASHRPRVDVSADDPQDGDVRRPRIEKVEPHLDEFDGDNVDAEAPAKGVKSP